MKDQQNINVCKCCFYDIGCESSTALALYLDICYRHLDGCATILFFESGDTEFEDLNFLERQGYVVSADCDEKDCIQVIPRIRQVPYGELYCKEKKKHGKK